MTPDAPTDHTNAPPASAGRAPEVVDVLIVGAGPAGLAAAAFLAGTGAGRVLVLEREAKAGGIPRHCAHSPYGMREYHRVLLGPAYARRLVAEARTAGAEIRTRVTVTALHAGPEIEATCATAGPIRIIARAVLLATGARETPRAPRLIGGTRPAGILNTGALQGIVHLDHLRPFRRPVILGTELVAFSALLTCRQAGIRPVAMIEPEPRPTARWPAALLPRLMGVPLMTDTEIVAIEGRTRVEGVRLRQLSPKAGRTNAIETLLPADGVVLTGGFVPEASLLAGSAIMRDPATGGPEVDEHGRCSLPGYFSAGNLLRAVETGGACYFEGRAVAVAILRALNGQTHDWPSARLTTGAGLRYVMPQRIAGGATPALGRLHLRLSAPAQGLLEIAASGKTLARRQINSLPERRVTLPLPPPGLAAEVRITPRPGPVA